jgi:hypothetical protein
MAAFVKYDCFAEDLAEKKHNLSADQLYVALSNYAPIVETQTTFNLSDVRDLTHPNYFTPLNNGYVLGGNPATIISSSRTGGTYKLVLADVVFTATANMGPFRYAILWNGTSSVGLPLIGYYDYGSSITLTTGDTFTVNFDDGDGALTII